MAGDSFTIGNAEVIALHDLAFDFPTMMMFPNIPAPEFDAFRELYPASFGKIGMAADCGSYAIRSSGKTVIVDTGIGPGPIQMLGGAAGNLVPDMKAKGINPEDVDAVVHTHLHVDHVGWNMVDGKPTFPNATYYAPRGDYEAFSQNLAANPQMNVVMPLKDLGRLELYSGVITITPEITTVPTPGHSPDHHSVLLNSGGEKLLVMGDVAHHPAQVENCHWSPSFDLNGEQAAATREKMMKRLETEGHLAAFCHFPESGIGRIVRANNMRTWQPI